MSKREEQLNQRREHDDGSSVASDSASTPVQMARNLSALAIGNSAPSPNASDGFNNPPAFGDGTIVASAKPAVQQIGAGAAEEQVHEDHAAIYALARIEGVDGLCVPRLFELANIDVSLQEDPGFLPKKCHQREQRLFLRKFLKTGC